MIYFPLVDWKYHLFLQSQKFRSLADKLWIQSIHLTTKTFTKIDERLFLMFRLTDVSDSERSVFGLLLMLAMVKLLVVKIISITLSGRWYSKIA